MYSIQRDGHSESSGMRLGRGSGTQTEHGARKEKEKNGDVRKKDMVKSHCHSKCSHSGSVDLISSNRNALHNLTTAVFPSSRTPICRMHLFTPALPPPKKRCSEISQFFPFFIRMLPLSVTAGPPPSTRMASSSLPALLVVVVLVVVEDGESSSFMNSV